MPDPVLGPLQRLLLGLDASRLKLHITSTLPPGPVHLDELTDAAWPGYAPADWLSSNRGVTESGLAYNEGTAYIPYSGGASIDAARGMYLVAEGIDSPQCLGLIAFEDPSQQIVRPGGMWYVAIFQIFRNPT